MNLTGLRDALKNEPFEPFTIRLTDGRTEHIKHPEFVAVGPGVVIVVRDDNSWTKIEPLLIVALDFAATGKNGGNGSTKKRRKE